MDTVTNLWSGRTGLAKTYWLWGVLSGIPWGLALSLVTPGSQLAIVTVLACVMYYVIVHVGIWRAASQYQGFKAWAILAKIAVAITPACLVIGTLAAIVIPAMHQPSRQGPHRQPQQQILRKWTTNLASPPPPLKRLEKLIFSYWWPHHMQARFQITTKFCRHIQTPCKFPKIIILGNGYWAIQKHGM